MTAKPFPLPVRVIGPGSQVEDDALNYLTMPQGMATYAPRVPDAPAPGERAAAIAALESVRTALKRFADGTCALSETQRIDLTDLDAADRALINEVLGEGEVAAQIDATHRTQVQESVFAGVWRVLALDGDSVLSDSVEVGAVPRVIGFSAGLGEPPRVPSAAAEGVMNAPALLEEVADKARHFRPDRPAHVVNLTLLPLSPADRALIDAQLGRGNVSILSRGYGNCRITSTAAPHCWRVTYFNSQDTVILDTIEVTSVPEVARAAIEDLVDSYDRLGEVLEWIEAK